MCQKERGKMKQVIQIIPKNKDGKNYVKKPNQCWKVKCNLKIKSLNKLKIIFQANYLRATWQLKKKS